MASALSLTSVASASAQAFQPGPPVERLDTINVPKLPARALTLEQARAAIQAAVGSEKTLTGQPSVALAANCVTAVFIAPATILAVIGTRRTTPSWSPATRLAGCSSTAGAVRPRRDADGRQHGADRDLRPGRQRHLRSNEVNGALPQRTCSAAPATTRSPAARATTALRRGGQRHPARQGRRRRAVRRRRQRHR